MAAPPARPGQNLAGLHWEVAGGQVRTWVACLDFKNRLGGAAEILCFRAPRVEPASGGGVDRRRNIAGQDDSLPFGGGVWVSGRRRGKQRGGVGVPGVVVDLVAGA